MRDLYVDGKLLALRQICDNKLTPVIRSSLVNVISAIPPCIKNVISRNIRKMTAIFLFQTINYNGNDHNLMHMDAKAVYSVLIFEKVKMPRGLLNWCGDLEIYDSQIKTALTSHIIAVQMYLIGFFSTKLLHRYFLQMNTLLGTKQKIQTRLPGAVPQPIGLFLFCIEFGWS